MWQKIKNYYHLIQAFWAAFYYHFPSREIKVIGVTGTDGKTTTVHMIYEILAKNGFKTSYISSVHAAIGSKIHKTGFHVTTPSAWQVQRFLRQAVNAKHAFFVIEATSHGLDQNRLGFIDFEVGVITNITHEHLDYHKTWENYALSKLKLLKKAKHKIVNLDDNSFKFISGHIKNDLITYGLAKNAQINPVNLPIKVKIKETYNLYNALAATAVGLKLGLNLTKIIRAINRFENVEGRMQSVDFTQDFRTFIDFAHTPNAIEKALVALKGLVAKKTRIICVFGAAGERDKAKRPLMGKAADDNSDIIILTAEDPRTESVDQICQEIKKGIKHKKENKNLFIIYDREQAINFAISLAESGDIVVMFGKGHERSMCYGTVETPWNEFEVTNKAIKRKLNDKSKK